MKAETNNGLVETRDSPKWTVFSLLTLITDFFLNGKGQKAGVKVVTVAVLKSWLVGWLALFHSFDPKKGLHSPSKLTW